MRKNALISVFVKTRIGQYISPIIIRPVLTGWYKLKLKLKKDKIVILLMLYYEKLNSILISSQLSLLIFNVIF